MPYKDPAAKAANARARLNTPEGRALHQARTTRHNATEKGQASKRKYKKSEAGKAAEERYRATPIVRLRQSLRRRLLNAIKEGQTKTASAVRDLGMSIPDFMKYIESKPTWLPEFTWDNQGQIWHLDHVKALGLFDLTDPEQLLQAVHHSNIQPLSTEAHAIKTTNDIRLVAQLRAQA